MEDFILDALDSIGKFDFALLGRFILYSYIGLWALIALWVWFDSGERTRSYFLRVLSVIVVFFGQLLGLLLYMILRAKNTLTEQYWSDLEKRFLLYETAELDDCPNCNYALTPGFNNCPNCNYTLKVKCPDCEVMLDKDWNYCPYCSKEMGGVYPDRQKLAREIRAESRKQQSQSINTKQVVAKRFDAVKNSVGGYISKVKQSKVKSESQDAKQLAVSEADVEAIGENTTTEPIVLKEDSSLKVEASPEPVLSTPESYVEQAVPVRKKRKDVGFVEFLGMLGSAVLAPFKPKPKMEKKVESALKSSDSVETINVEGDSSLELKDVGSSDNASSDKKQKNQKLSRRERRKKKRRNR